MGATDFSAKIWTCGLHIALTLVGSPGTKKAAHHLAVRGT